MGEIVSFLLMDAATAQMLRSGTANQQHRLGPELVLGGEYAGQYVLPEAVRSDPHHARWREVLDSLLTVLIDMDVAWPPMEI